MSIVMARLLVGGRSARRLFIYAQIEASVVPARDGGWRFFFYRPHSRLKRVGEIFDA